MSGAELLKVIRGSGGGHMLDKDPKEIFLCDIVTLIEGRGKSNARTNDEAALEAFFEETEEAYTEILKNISLVDVYKKLNSAK